MENYKEFLESVDSDIKKIFEFQKEYLFCKEGCSHCCKRGDFPMSELEFKYLMLEYENLSQEIKEKIQANIKEVKKGDTTSYVCPFLVDDKCTVYNNRPLVCRAFGVLTEDAQGNPSFPFCTTLGLNYSQIYDEDAKHLSFELYKKGNFKNFPKIFRLSNKVIMNTALAKKLNIDFGKIRKMIDFL